jgi:hypothetical protein
MNLLLTLATTTADTDAGNADAGNAVAGNAVAGILILLVLIPTMIGLWLIPGFVANARKHHNRAAIWAVNILLGWNLIGWIVIWAFSNPVTVSSPSMTAQVQHSSITKHADGTDSHL